MKLNGNSKSRPITNRPVTVLFTLFLSCTAIAGNPGPLKMKVIPLNELIPKSGLPLNLTVPEHYIWLNKFVKIGSVLVLCADDDERRIYDNGDFSRARNAVITIRPSSGDYYDKKQHLFSFEPGLASQIKAIGGKNLSLAKKEIKGVPVAVVTFEFANRKFYSLAFATDTRVVRLSYNARTQPRSYDDKVWSSLVSGL